MNYSKIIKNDFTAAPGVSVTLFVCGCAHRCPGCHNPELWDENAGQEFTDTTTEEIICAIGANGIKRNLCLMGGEPFFSGNDLKLVQLIAKVRDVYPDIEVYAWTGYTYEELYNSPKPSPYALLQAINYLIDGPYIQEQRDITLKMRGSSNQRILRLENGRVAEELQ